MRIAMLGAGYVGLVSGACFAEFGVEVCLVDTDAAKVAGLREGRIPIYEPGLDRLVEDNAREGRLRAEAHLEHGGTVPKTGGLGLGYDKR